MEKKQCITDGVTERGDTASEDGSLEQEGEQSGEYTNYYMFILDMSYMFGRFNEKGCACDKIKGEIARKSREVRTLLPTPPLQRYV